VKTIASRAGTKPCGSVMIGYLWLTGHNNYDNMTEILRKCCGTIKMHESPIIKVERQDYGKFCSTERDLKRAFD
jgi:hypothetical protein